MKRIHLAALLAALAAGTAHADEVMSGVQNSGEFAPVPQGVSQWRRDPNPSGYSGITNPGNFAPVRPAAPVSTDAVETSVHRSYDEVFSGVTNPGNFGEARKTDSAQIGSRGDAKN
jgi:hypothetical protein